MDKFNQENGLALQPYSLAAFGCMMVVSREYGEYASELIFDHLEKVNSKLTAAREYAKSDMYNQGDFDRMVISPLLKAITFRELPAMQAADFMTWEFRKHHERVGEWFDLPDRPKDDDERWAHMERWSLGRFQSPIPTPRKSAVALVEGNQLAPFIWDYDHLCEAHQLRAGKWA